MKYAWCCVIGSGSLVKDQAEGTNVASVNEHRTRDAKRASQQYTQTWSIYARIIGTSDERKTRKEEESASTFASCSGAKQASPTSE